MSLPRLRAVPLVALAVLVIAAVVAVQSTPPARPRVAPVPRHLILISLDTLRADHLGAWGYDRTTSPRLDALAEKSVVFRRAVAQGSSTIPSHASLFTSQYASSVLSSFGGVMPGVDTLAEVLSEAGFATWGFVDGGNVRGHFGFDQGFDHYEDDRVGIERLVSRAKTWIEGHPAPRFFLFLHTYDIHTPYKAPERYVKLFGDPTYRGVFQPNTRYFREVERAGKGLSEREHLEVVARYDAGIRYTDERVGAFLDWLDEQSLLEDALVVITSDHGEEFLEHGRLGHQQLYLDPNLRVPLLFYGKGWGPRVVDETIELTDVVPTVLEALQLEPLPSAVGTSLVPYRAGRAPGPSRGSAYSEKGRDGGHETFITDRYQLIIDRKANERRLYDLQADPEATTDLWSEEPEVAARLSAELDARRATAVRRQEVNVNASRIWHKPKEMKEKVRRELEALGYLE